jgi:hypothetical protein
VGFLFLDGHTPIPNLEHIRVVPATRARHMRELLRLLEVEFHAGPVIFDVHGRPPTVARLRGPLPGIVLTPVANRVEDRSFERVVFQGVPHHWVSV